eukprot:5023746-Amphidinium_carterae.1
MPIVVPSNTRVKPDKSDEHIFEFGPHPTVRHGNSACPTGQTQDRSEEMESERLSRGRSSVGNEGSRCSTSRLQE